MWRVAQPLCKREQIKMGDYMEGRVSPPERITSPTLRLPPPCKQPLKLLIKYAIYRGHNKQRRIPITGGRTPIESFIQQLAACLALKM